MIQFLIDNKVVVLGFLFALSEVLALIPSVKANSIFQVIFDLLGKAKGAATKKEDVPPQA